MCAACALDLASLSGVVLGAVPVPPAEPDPLTDLVQYAGDVRWLELADGAAFTFVDRKMLADLHAKARIAAAYLKGRDHAR